MTLTETLNRSKTNLYIIAEIDISQLNVQWVNNGAGIWQVNALNVYDYVETEFVESGFSAQNFGYIGSVYVDTIQLSQVFTLAEVTTTPRSFYYNHEDRMLTITIINYDEPGLHQISIGVIYPTTYKDFTLSGLGRQVDSRLVSIPDMSISRDPLFWGRLKYGGGSLRIVNADGEYDTFGEDNNLFGNEVRVKIGNSDMSYSEFVTVTTKNIETVKVAEDYNQLSLIDKRKYLSEQIRYNCTDKNAVEAIQEILEDMGFTYGSSLYDTTEWADAITAARNVTIIMDSLDADETEEAINVIEWICLAGFCIFYLNDENKFTAKVVDITSAVKASIPDCDIMNKISVAYDPSRVISSVKVGYARDWATTENPYTYYTNITREIDIIGRYKVNRQKKFDTVLLDLADAQAFSEDMLDYAQDSHGILKIMVPLKYYGVNLGDMVNVEINRQNKTMIGEKKCEVIGKSYKFDSLAIMLTLWIVGDPDRLLVTDDGKYLRTADGKLLVEG